MHELPEISTSLTYLLIEEIYWFWVLSYPGLVLYSPLIDLHLIFEKLRLKNQVGIISKPNSYDA